MKYAMWSESGIWVAQLIDHDIVAQGPTPEKTLDRLRLTIQITEEEIGLDQVPPSPISHGFVRSGTL
jgi:hypothetical protein